MKENSPVWEKIRNLGAGGFGLVSLWKNTRSEQVLALKMCRNDDCNLDTKSLDNWCKEVIKMKQLDHPNIIRVLELPSGLADKSKYPILCMEFCTKGDLRKELCRPENICGLPEESVRSILRDVKAGIEYLHQSKITHRDLKPENIVMQEVHDTPNSSKTVYKLIDLGFAKEWDQSSLSSTFVGTLEYLAPELFIQQPYSRSVDYWSFGLVCHEIVTGFRPFLPSMSMHPTRWFEKVHSKSSEHICIYETVDGSFEYKREIFPENHITQPLKYALERWLSTALEWDGSKRGRSPTDDSLIIFTLLDAALKKKVVTVFSVKKLERLSYEIDDSTMIRTLKLWIERDTGVPVSNQLLLLPSGDSLHDPDRPILPHLDNDPKLVSMLYVVSKQESVKLPQVEILESKHPSLVRKMLESPTKSHSYYIVRRMWANSVFFIQSVLESYRGFIEAYSVKMLSLIQFKQKKLQSLQINISAMIQKLLITLSLSKDSLNVDLENVSNNPIALNRNWNYNPIEVRLSLLQRDVDKLLPEIEPRLQEIICLQDFGEPGSVHCDRLNQLLTESRKFYLDFVKLPFSARSQPHDSSPMNQIIFQLWEVIGRISNDETFEKHLQDFNKTDKSVNNLITNLSKNLDDLGELHDSIKRAHLNRQREIWKFCSRAINDPSHHSPRIRRSHSDQRPNSPNKERSVNKRITVNEMWLIKKGP